MAFDEMALKMVEERSLQAQEKLNNATNVKKQSNEMMDIELSKLKMNLNDIKSLEQALKGEQKQEKLNEDLTKKVEAQQSNVFIGNQPVPPPVNQDAQDVPFLDQIV